jgi:hypothetical protein
MCCAVCVLSHLNVIRGCSVARAAGGLGRQLLEASPSLSCTNGSLQAAAGGDRCRSVTVVLRGCHSGSEGLSGTGSAHVYSTARDCMESPTHAVDKPCEVNSARPLLPAPLPPTPSLPHTHAPSIPPLGTHSANCLHTWHTHHSPSCVCHSRQSRTAPPSADAQHAQHAEQQQRAHQGRATWPHGCAHAQTVCGRQAAAAAALCWGLSG